MRSKAFFINGGAGRVISSIPAFEKYAENNDDFIIVCEGGTDFFKGHPVLDGKVYDHWHKNLFQEHIIQRDCVSPEPYRNWYYYNQHPLQGITTGRYAGCDVLAHPEVNELYCLWNCGFYSCESQVFFSLLTLLFCEFLSPETISLPIFFGGFFFLFQ